MYFEKDGVGRHASGPLLVAKLKKLGYKEAEVPNASTEQERPLDKLKKAELEAKAQEMGLDIAGLKTREEILAAIMAKAAEGGGA